MTTTITTPSIISLPAPKRLLSYLSDDNQNMVFQWVVNQTDSLLPGQWTQLFRCPNNLLSLGWVATGTGATIELYKQRQIHNDYYYTYNLTDLDLTKGTTFEAEVQVLYGDTTGFIVDDGVHREQITITSTSVSLVNTDIVYNMNTMDTTHRYTVNILGDLITFFVDGIKIIEASITSASSGAQIIFGNFGITRTISGWERVKYNVGVVTQVTLNNLDYELLIDSADTFDTVNLRTFNKNSSLLSSYVNGLVASYGVTMPRRQFNSAITYYWKVRLTGSYFTSSYSEVKTCNIRKDISLDEFTNLWDLLPDDMSYSKEAESGNIAVLLKALGQQFDRANFATQRTADGISIDTVTDADIEDAYGLPIGLSAAQFSSSSEYRDTIRQAYTYLTASLLESSISGIISDITGKTPVIDEYHVNDYWIIHDLSDTSEDYYIEDLEWPTLRPIELQTLKSRAFTWDLHVFNPYDFTYSYSVIQSLILLMKTAYSKVNILYYASNGTMLRVPFYYAIDNYLEAYYTDANYTV